MFPKSSPPTKLVAIVPSDDTLFLPPLRAIYVGGAGDVVVIGADDANPVTFKAPPVGTVLEVVVKKVMAATTATLLIGMR